jgi:hypothetical protein
MPLMEIMERWESKRSGIAIVWFSFDSRNTFASRGIASIEISQFISYHIYNLSMGLGDFLQMIHLSLVISYRLVRLSL